ncbi:hypothetical protein D3C71_1758060 [compost metagenome]
MGAGQYRLNHFRAALAGQVAHLQEQLGPHRVFAIERTRHRDHQNQHRRQRKHHVKRQRGALAGRAVGRPLAGGIHQQPADLGRTQGSQALGKAHRAGQREAKEPSL